MAKNRIFYGWIIVVSCLIITSTLFGMRSSFGVFFKSLESEFELNRALTSSVFSLTMLFSAAFAVIGGWAMDKYGPKLVIFGMGFFTGLGLIFTSLTTSLWQLFLSFSLLVSVGSGGTMPVMVAAVSPWFKKKRGLAMGIVTAGSGLGIAAIAPFSAYLISVTDWRAAFLITGLLSLAIVMPLSFLIKRDPSETGSLPDGEPTNKVSKAVFKPNVSGDNQPFTFAQAWRMGSFRMLVLVFFLFSFCLNLVMTHVVPYATDRGIPAIEAATVLSVISGFSAFGRLSTGRVADALGRRTPGLVCAVLQISAMIWLIWSRELWSFYLFAVIFGLGWGGLGVIMIILVADIFHGRSLGLIMGIADMGFLIGAAIGPALAGYIFDATSSYTIAFILGATGVAVVALFIILITGRVKAHLLSKSD